MKDLSSSENIKTWLLANAFLFLFTSCEKPERLVKLTTLDAVAEDISYTTATLRGEITDLGSKPIEEHGIMISKSYGLINPEVNGLTTKAQKGTYQIPFTGLDKNTLYYFRAYVTIEGSPIYSSAVKQFTTKETGQPVVTTGALGEITLNTAQVSGEVTSDGGESVTKRGLCWGLSIDPVLSSCLDTTINGEGTGPFTGALHLLSPATQYFARAYAINIKGTSYGTSAIVTTFNIPTLSTATISYVTNTGALSGGTVSNDGGSAVTMKGVCWSTSSSPTVLLSTKTTDGPGSGSFESSITGLAPGQSYFVRAYATNIFGTNYGNELPLLTTQPATTTTNDATSVTTTTAVLNGTVNPNNYSTAVVFEYGTTTSYGSFANAAQSPVSGTTALSVSAVISELIPGITYHYRVKATNTGGISEGNDKTFITLLEPSATTGTGTTLTASSATITGIVNANNSATSISFDYGKSLSYESIAAATPATATGNTSTAVSAGLTSLSEGTTYHFRVRAESAGGTTLGDDQTFTTLFYPSATTSAASPVEAISAFLNGTVNANNSSTIVTFDYGTSTGYGLTATASQSPVSGNSATAVSAGLIGLTEGTLYHFRVKAASAAGTVYGNDMTFRSLKPPAASTVAASDFMAKSAKLNGLVNANNFSTIVTFDYGLSASYGSTLTATQSPLTGETETSVTESLTGLSQLTTYHFRIRAVSIAGTTLGDDKVFTTLILPVASTLSAGSVTNVTALIQGSVNANNLTTTVSFEYGPTTSYGSEISGNPAQVTGSTSATINGGLTGLERGTTYHFRIKAVNEGGTVYGNDMSFTTTNQTISDFDGNIYNTVIIGSQKWTQENLKVTHYLNGDLIPEVQSSTSWAALSSGAYSNYDNSTSYAADYGRLYNFHTTVDNRNLCPAGWHVPSNAEWNTLASNLGGESVAGAKMKETGITHWPVSNSDATNESGFTALPGGYRNSVGSFGGLINWGAWWSSTEAYTKSLGYSINSILTASGSVNDGLSIRCIEGEGLVLAAISTNAVSGINSVSATSGGNITADGGTAITISGICWSSSHNPTISNSKTTDGLTTGTFASNISGLSPGTLYYVRAYATNSVGTAYGNEVSFTTDPEVISDKDGNVYNVIRIGTQLWTKENLKTTTLSDNIAITNVTDPGTWNGLSTPAYCWYYNDPSYKPVYGALYNWFSVNTGKLCPTGWHVPTEGDWNTITNYLIDNGFGYLGSGTDIAKSLAATSGWQLSSTPGYIGNDQATNNASGFSALPGGYCYFLGSSFSGGGINGIWWTSNEWDLSSANCRYLESQSDIVSKGSRLKIDGISVRCIKD